jgi:hypothetical protein
VLNKNPRKRTKIRKASSDILRKLTIMPEKRKRCGSKIDNFIGWGYNLEHEEAVA